MVCVGPPLLANPAVESSGSTLSPLFAEPVLANPQLESSEMLNPASVIAPWQFVLGRPTGGGWNVLLARMVLLRLADPEKLKMPPVAPMLLENVPLVTVNTP